ncbi:hypothetical protein CWE03_07910 [Lactobacillus johnsonii]|nr:hypothetical protein CWE03_07910 [Lactobacillus johnsonii]
MLGRLISKINSIFLKASKREPNKVESENIYFIRIISKKIGFFLKTLSKKNGTIKIDVSKTQKIVEVNS